MTTTAPLTKSAELPTGVTLQYVEQGDADGVPVVLLHGLSDSWRSFEGVLAQLPETIRAFAVSQRGHGDSDKPAGGYPVELLAADVAAFIDVAGISPAIVVGHSMGGSVAQQLAIAHPGRVRGVVLAGAFAGFRGNPAIEELRDYAENVLADPVDPGFLLEFQESTVARPVADGLIDTAVAESLKVPARVFRAAVAGLLESELRPRLGAISAPALLVWGDRDAFVPRADQDEQAATIAGARLVVYRGHGHAMHWEDPRRFAADLVAFAATTA